MNAGSEITVGAIAIVKVGRNEVEVTVTGITERGWMVKSRSTGREFEVMHLERIINRQTAEDSPNPVPECGNPAKKLSLLDAATGSCRQPDPDEYQRTGCQGDRDESLGSDRSENAGADALQRHFPRNQDP